MFFVVGEIKTVWLLKWNTNTSTVIPAIIIHVTEIVSKISLFVTLFFHITKL